MTHLLFVCDTFDYDHYPVFVRKNESVDTVYKNYLQKDMQRILKRSGHIKNSFLYCFFLLQCCHYSSNFFLKAAAAIEAFSPGSDIMQALLEV